jgi:hypothetical protein
MDQCVYFFSFVLLFQPGHCVTKYHADCLPSRLSVFVSLAGLFSLFRSGEVCCANTQAWVANNSTVDIRC